MSKAARNSSAANAQFVRAEAAARFERAKTEIVRRHDRFEERYGGMHPSALHNASAGNPLRPVVGSPDTVAREVQKMVDLGLRHLLVRFLGEWAGETRGIAQQSMEMFAHEVMHRFR